MPGFIPRNLLDSDPNADADPTYRMSMLPFGTYADPNGGGEHLGFAMPGMIQEPVNALMRLAQNSRFEDGHLGIPNPQNLDNQHDVTSLLEALTGGNATRGAGAVENAAARAYESVGTRRAPLPEFAVDQMPMSDSAPIVRRPGRALLEDPAVPPFNLTKDPSLPTNSPGELRWPSDWAERDFRLDQGTQARGFSDLYSDTGKPSLLGAAVAGAEGNAPITGYHGTNADFTNFNMPAYFSTDRRYANKFEGPDGGTMQASLTPKNPYWTNDQQFIESLRSFPERVDDLKAKGHDAAIFSSKPGNTDPILQLGGYAHPQVVMFDPAGVDTLHKWQGDKQLYSDNLPSLWGNALSQDQDEPRNSLFNF